MVCLEDIKVAGDSTISSGAMKNMLYGMIVGSSKMNLLAQNFIFENLVLEYYVVISPK